LIGSLAKISRIIADKKPLEVGPLALGKLAEFFFSAEDYTNMSYYNCCGIRPKHSNISKRVGEGVITICVVLRSK
jgi:hypothetical protein